MNQEPLTVGNIGRRGAHATLWSAVEIGTRYGVQIAVTVVLARLLKPEDFGLLAILLVFTSVGALLTDAGFGAALIQKRESTPDDEVTIFYMTMLTGGLAAFLLWIAASGIAEFYRMPNLVPTAHAIAWVLPMGAVGSVPDALLTKRLDFRSRTHAQLMSSLISGVVGIFLAFQGAGIWSLVFQALSETGMRSLMLWVFSAWRPRGRFSYKSLNALFGFGGFMLLSGILSTVSTRIQSLLIGKLFDARELGLYALAQNASQAPASFVGGILNRVGLPLFSGLAHDKSTLRLALSASLQVSMFAFLPCMVGIALLSHPLIELVYGAQWDAAAPMLSLLALATAFWPVHVLNLVALSAQGRSDLYFRLEIFKNLITVIATVIASPFGPAMVAGAILIGSLCALVINTWYSGKILGYGLVSQVYDQAKTFLCTLLSILPAAYIMYLTRVPKALAITYAIAVACLLYLGCAIVLKHPALKEFRNLLHSISSKFNPTSCSNKPN